MSEMIYPLLQNMVDDLFRLMILIDKTDELDIAAIDITMKKVWKVSGKFLVMRELIDFPLCTHLPGTKLVGCWDLGKVQFIRSKGTLQESVYSERC